MSLSYAFCHNNLSFGEHWSMTVSTSTLGKCLGGYMPLQNIHTTYALEGSCPQRICQWSTTSTLVLMFSSKSDISILCQHIISLWVITAVQQGAASSHTIRLRLSVYANSGVRRLRSTRNPPWWGVLHILELDLLTPLLRSLAARGWPRNVINRGYIDGITITLRRCSHNVDS